MRFLVTGCAGFIGSTITDTLLAGGDEVVGVDCFTDYYDIAAKNANLSQALSHESFELHALDLASAELPADLWGVDGVFHLAAQAGVRASWGDEFATYTSCNVLATQRLLEAAVHAGAPPLVYASSSSVYGNAQSRPTSEDALPAPISPYGVTKLAAEHLVDTYRHEFGLRAMSLRFFTVYGPRQRPDMAFHRFIAAAVEGRPISIYGDGMQSRDFTYVDDIVGANLASMQRLQQGDPGSTCNVGGGSTVTVREVIELLGVVLGRSIEASFGETQAGDVRHTSADCSRAQHMIGYAPSVSLSEGLDREVGWFAASRDVRAI